MDFDRGYILRSCFKILMITVLCNGILYGAFICWTIHMGVLEGFSSAILLLLFIVSIAAIASQYIIIRIVRGFGRKLHKYIIIDSVSVIEPTELVAITCSVSWFLLIIFVKNIDGSRILIPSLLIFAGILLPLYFRNRILSVAEGLNELCICGAKVLDIGGMVYVTLDVLAESLPDRPDIFIKNMCNIIHHGSPIVHSLARCNPDILRSWGALKEIVDKYKSVRPILGETLINDVAQHIFDLIESILDTLERKLGKPVVIAGIERETLREIRKSWEI